MRSVMVITFIGAQIAVFGDFSLMLTDMRTDSRTYGRRDPLEEVGTCLKNTKKEGRGLRV